MEDLVKQYPPIYLGGKNASFFVATLMLPQNVKLGLTRWYILIYNTFMFVH